MVLIPTTPTIKHTDDEVEAMIEGIANAMSPTNTSFTVLIEDFNAKWVCGFYNSHAPSSTVRYTELRQSGNPRKSQTVWKSATKLIRRNIISSQAGDQIKCKWAYVF